MCVREGMCLECKETFSFLYNLHVLQFISLVNSTKLTACLRTRDSAAAFKL
jgi:hypothetical protein